jgi:putative protease
MDHWRRVGIQHFRLEFVHESPQQVTQIADVFRMALNGELSAQELARQLHQRAPQGTTEGSLFVRDNYLMIPLVQ